MDIKEIGQGLGFLEKLHKIWLHNLNLEFRDGQHWRFLFFNDEFMVSIKWNEFQMERPWIKEIKEDFGAEKLISAIEENLARDQDLKRIHEKYLVEQIKGLVI